MLSLDGYQPGDELYRSSRTLVFRARRSDGTPVVVKTLAERTPSPEAVLGLHAEYRLASRVDHPGVVRTLALERGEFRPALIMADSGGAALQQALDGPLALALALRLGLQVAEALAELHRLGITHKDINPANLILSPDGQTVQIADFSLASTLQREGLEEVPAGAVEGTLPYISPEQTGRTNRSVDYRTDLYSLGVTLYQLLTGALPFAQGEPMELVHAHLARRPRPPHLLRPELPRAVSRVVLRLLAKTAEERYQSAAGLGRDLGRCLEAVERGAAAELAGFEPGRDDRSPRFQLPERLYGRDAELLELGEGVQRATEGSRQIMLLSGTSGIGKTTLGGEAKLLAGQERGWFVRGQFEPGAGAAPYAGWLMAGRELTRQLLAEPEERLAPFRESLRQSLGEDWAVMVNALPELKLLLGVPPTPAPMHGEEAERRFAGLVCRFVRAAVQYRRPLVVFLDDLQWADPASLHLLEAVLADDKVHYLLLLGAYRDDDLPAGHPLRLTLRRLADGPAPLSRLPLSPLAEVDLAALLADTLARPAAELGELAALLRQRSLGNPLFVHQLLRRAQRAGAITFDHAAGRFELDAGALRALDLPADLVALLLQALDTLPRSTVELLQLAACVGIRFHLRTLAELSGRPLAEVVEGLHPAIEAGLVQTVCGGFGQLLWWSRQRDVPVPVPSARVQCQFHHDRVRRAVARMMPAEERGRVRLTLGRALLGRLSAEELDERLFEVVGHLRRGAELMEEPAERLKTAELLCRAGRKAAQSGSRLLARGYYERGIALLPDGAWQQQQAVTFELHRGLHETLVLDTEHNQRCLDLGQELLERAETRAQRLSVLPGHVVQLSTRGGDPAGALRLGVSALAEFGIDLDPPDVQQAARQGFAELERRWGERPLEELEELPRASDPEHLAVMSLVESLFFFPIYRTRRELGPLAALAGIELSLRYGNSPVTGAAYATLGALVGHQWGDFTKACTLAEVGERLAETVGGHEGMARNVAHLARWPSMTPAASRELALGNHRRALELGQPIPAAISAGVAVAAGLQSGMALGRFLELCRIGEYIAAELPDIGPRENTLNQRFGETVTGKRPLHPMLFASEAERELGLDRMQRRNPEAVHVYHTLCGLLHLILGETEQADAALARSEAFCDRNVGHMNAYITPIYRALALGRRWDGAEAGERPALLAGVAERRALVQGWVEGGAGAYFEVWDLLLGAELSRLQGDLRGAGQGYERAIARAGARGELYAQALACEQAQRHYAGLGLGRVAEAYLRDAHAAYQRWGAAIKVARLDREHPELTTPAPGGTSQSTSETSHGSSSGGRSAQLDLATVLKVTREISGEMDLDRLLEVLLLAMVENTGAERGFLLLRDGAQLNLAASHDPEADEAETAADPERLSWGVARYVARSGEGVVLDDAAREGTFRTDPYVSRRRPRSLLCAPMVNQGKLVGVVYLENNLSAGVFSDDRLETVTVLCAQAAISIENARLYRELADYSHTLEQKVEARTRDLGDKNRELALSLERERQMQQQMLLQEKMASLGTLVAGVAHEVNTPIGAVQSSTDTAARCLVKVRGALERGEGLADNRRLGRWLELLEESHGLIGRASERVDQIVRSLRNFARLDEAELKRADVAQGLQSTLELLRHRLKSGLVEVKVEHGELPQILCYPNQLNQVLMNLLINAIDAVEASGRPGTVTVRAEPEGKGLRLSVSDTGPGMSEAVRRRVFDPGFTTKGVGVGTGLGLSICYNIVVKRHGGTISVESAPGEGATFTVVLPGQPPEELSGT